MGLLWISRLRWIAGNEHSLFSPKWSKLNPCVSICWRCHVLGRWDHPLGQVAVWLDVHFRLAHVRMQWTVYRVARHLVDYVLLKGFYKSHSRVGRCRGSPYAQLDKGNFVLTKARFVKSLYSQASFCLLLPCPCNQSNVSPWLLSLNTYLNRPQATYF